MLKNKKIKYDQDTIWQSMGFTRNWKN
jgi:hypothetical protein